MSHIPQSITRAALALRANVGRDYDSQGKHVAFWYRAPGTEWKVYRGTVTGMLSLLRQVARHH